MTMQGWSAKLMAMKQCGYTAEDRAAILQLRKAMVVLLIVFLGVQAVMRMRLSGAAGMTVAVLAGACFCGIMGVAWAVVLRSADEYRRVLLQRSVMWALGLTLGAVTVCGYVEVGMRTSLHVPLLAVPLCFVMLTAAMKLVVFRRAAVDVAQA
jgi:hypothetical protein